VSNENDENSGSTRMTRAKSARLTTTDEKVVQTKKSTVNASTQPAQRKRAALGDVSNVTKVEVVDGKKAAAGKTGLVSKAAQPSGIQKAHSRTASTRTVLATKEVKKTEVKRTGSGSGSIGVVQKRKASSTASSVKEDIPAEEGEPLRKKAHTQDVENRIQPDAKRENASSKPAVEAESKASARPFPKGVDNLDSEDIDDPLMVAEYANEIFDYLRDLETTSAPNPLYMDHQDDLEWKTRGILVDWLVEVHTRFHLLPETLFLAVNIIDRFLSEKVVQLDRLQLVGVTAMFIASKYEEVLSPHVANFRHVADDGFSEAEILSAERFVLQTLNYDLSYPNPMNFLRRISKADNYDIQSRTIGKYLMEISLLDHRFMHYLPSHIAAGAMYLSRLILDRGEWVSFGSVLVAMTAILTIPAGRDHRILRWL
jgi:G2/mitotic-specific cyclin 2